LASSSVELRSLLAGLPQRILGRTKAERGGATHMSIDMTAIGVMIGTGGIIASHIESRPDICLRLENAECGTPVGLRAISRPHFAAST
jgi:hypothetical protein